MAAPLHPSSVLVVTAHPDDVDFGAGGQIALWTSAGIPVSYCLVTDGDAGGFDPAVPRSEIAGIRRREQTEAAAVLGVNELHFLGYPDGRVVASLDLRRDISRVIRQVRPDIVLCQSPERDYTRLFASHPDHLAAAEATVCAVYPDARNPFTFTELVDEGFEAHTVRQLWLMGGPAPTTWVDTTEVFDRKLQALLCHASQHQDPVGMQRRVRDRSESLGRSAGMPEGRTAEAFQVIETG